MILVARTLKIPQKYQYFYTNPGKITCQDDQSLLYLTISLRCGLGIYRNAAAAMAALKARRIDALRASSRKTV